MAPRIGRRTAMTVGGVTLLGVGLLAMPMPIVPGFPMAIAGLALLRRARRYPAPRPHDEPQVPGTP